MFFEKNFLHSIDNEYDRFDCNERIDADKIDTDVDSLIKLFNENTIIKNNSKEQEFWKLVRLLDSLEQKLSNKVLITDLQLSEELLETFQEYNKFFNIILSGPCPNIEEVRIARFIETICKDGCYMSLYDYYCNSYFILSSIKRRLEYLENEDSVN